jgi:uncharacterized protein YlaI
LKQSLERLHVACGLKELLGTVDEETISALKDANLDVKNGFCEGCSVRVDIVGFQV